MPTSLVRSRSRGRRSSARSNSTAKPWT
jgi:hypothetical protein